jgi:hypothetical protein
MVAEQSRPLRDMLRAEKDAGVSFREMSARAVRHGQEISHSQLADYASGKVRSAPNARQIEALAAALDTGIGVIREAVMQEWYGYTPRELGRMKGSRVAAAIPSTLTTEEEAELIRLIEAWLRARPTGT